MSLVKKVIDGKIVEVEEPDVIIKTDDTDDTDDLEDVHEDELEQLDDKGSDDGDKKDDEDDEPWMATEDEQTLPDVPVATHIRVKQKLKGRLADQQDELEKLRRENEELKKGIVTPAKPDLKIMPKRPKEDDYGTIQEYQEALEEYEDKKAELRLEAVVNARQQKSIIDAARAKLESSVDEHYTRAAKLVEKNKISPEVYQQADRTVRKTVDAIIPGKGDLVVDQVIAVLGEGSEKVLYYLGRNKKALENFERLLSEDKTGLQASVFLGQQKERLLNTKRRTSNARPPADDVTGDGNNTSDSSKGKALLKKRKAAMEKGNIQLAYNIKKQAREAGIDVSDW